ncbi:hypothetical protein KDL01_16545 [Actinospica durhamensis]|uniref:Nitroreductase domain-containing protein n=1 Tax=Actinospica durhamensis TaxID=1508375 RepID=A0A941IP99_9ACTN|nr:nitroreductase family protein [Actinospica durhamensis]MBR7834884.1 hypothetical protein [Actinospica durhamensis]
MSESADEATPTQVLHRLTSYEFGRHWTVPPDDPRVLRDLQVNDPARLPWFAKRYPPDSPRLPLPRELPTTDAPVISVLAGTAQVAPGELDLPQLSRLLYLSAGVVRTMQQRHGIQPFRAAGSAGGRFPLELYVAVPEGTPLPPGVHWYDPMEHALVQVGPAPHGGAPAVIVTGVPWRTGWRYRERGWRHMYWDAGTMIAQLLALADSAGLPTALHTTFPDAAVAALTGADRVHELPVAVVRLGQGTAALDPSGPAITGHVDASPVEFPLVTAAQQAGERDRLDAPWDRGPAARVPDCASPTVEAVIAAKGSQRRMDSTRGLPEDLLRTCMSVAVRGVALPHWVVVHDVEGLAPGLYRWPDLDAPVLADELRDELHRICLYQALAHDAAFVTIAATDIGRLDDREYRAAQLAAGLVEGRLHLAAYALGASASGMTFTDSEIAPLLGEPLDGLLFTCVGVPEYTSAPAGPPGAAARVRAAKTRE